MKIDDKIISLCETKNYKKGAKAIVLDSYWIESEEFLRIKTGKFQLQVLAENWKKI